MPREKPGCPRVSVPFCALCGTGCDESRKFRVFNVSAVQDLVKQRCVPTAFHYASVMRLDGGGRHPLCMPCVNWMHRAHNIVKHKGCRKRAVRETYTPLDSVVMYALAPGHCQEPDQRSLGRLAAVACEEKNGFAAVVPEEIRAILRRSQVHGREMIDAAMLFAWWRANESTLFFRHSETARAVRHTCLVDDPTQFNARKRWKR
jgi:hypothetical protein